MTGPLLDFLLMDGFFPSLGCSSTIAVSALEMIASGSFQVSIPSGLLATGPGSYRQLSNSTWNHLSLDRCPASDRSPCCRLDSCHGCGSLVLGKALSYYTQITSIFSLVVYLSSKKKDSRFMVVGLPSHGCKVVS